MSTAPQPPGTPPPAGAATLPPTGTTDRQEVTVVSHSNLFYWWPVWAVAFLMAMLTRLDGYLMVTVPPGTKAQVAEKPTEREAWVLPEGARVTRVNPADEKSSPREPFVHMARRKSYGVIFCITLLIVVVITNVPLRGMWSVVVILTIIMLSVIFALAGWWERIFSAINLLDIRINMGGYLFIGIFLFAIWLITMLAFDRQIYIVFTPGQFKVCTEIGGGEKVYDTIGLTLERQRSDLFRHLILGLGSGDLVVKTSGAQAHHFDLPNVLFISKKVQMIEDLLQKKKVLESR
jgi:hypothetical protein